MLAAGMGSSAGRSLESSLKGESGSRLDKLFMDGPIWLQWPIAVVWCVRH